MPESIQHKLDRVRPPRVQITYDVEIGDAIEKKELPFVVGIMADLSGQPDKDLSADRPDPSSFNGKTRPEKKGAPAKPLKERKYIEIDRDNFNSVMESIAPRLVLSVNNETHRPYDKEEESKYRKAKKLREEDKIPTTLFRPKEEAGTKPVELEFLSLDDFSPIHIVKQVSFLRDLLDARNRLSDLLTKLDGNVDLDEQLKLLIADAANLKKVQGEKAAAAELKKAADAAKKAAAQQAAQPTDADVKEVTDAKKLAAEAQAAADAAKQALTEAQAVAAAKKAAAEAQAAATAQKAATEAQKAEGAQKAVEQAQAVAAAQKVADEAQKAADELQKAADEAQKALDAKKGKK